MKKDIQEPTQKEIIETLLRFNLSCNRDPVNIKWAFRNLTELWPQGPRFNFFYFVHLIIENKSLQQIAESLLSAKRTNTRADADAGSPKRNSVNYKGRKKGDIWKDFKEVEKILSLGNLGKWKQRFGIDRLKHFELQTKVIEAMGKGTFDPLIVGYSRQAVGHMVKELIILWSIFDLFNKEIERAKKEGDTFSLNTTKKIWREDAGSAFEIKNGKQRGRRIDEKSASRRVSRVRKYLNTGELTTPYQTGRFYNQDKFTYLSLIAHEVYKLFFHNLEWEKRRIKAIAIINRLATHYSIMPEEISFPILRSTRRGLLGNAPEIPTGVQSRIKKTLDSKEILDIAKSAKEIDDSVSSIPEKLI